MNQFTSITVNPEIQDGSPVFSGTRVRVETFYDYLRIGVSVPEFLSDNPSITPDQAYEVLSLSRKYSLDQLKSLVAGPQPKSYQAPAGREFSMPSASR